MWCSQCTICNEMVECKDKLFEQNFQTKEAAFDFPKALRPKFIGSNKIPVLCCQRLWIGFYCSLDHPYWPTIAYE